MISSRAVSLVYNEAHLQTCTLADFVAILVQTHTWLKLASYFNLHMKNNTVMKEHHRFVSLIG